MAEPIAVHMERFSGLLSSRLANASAVSGPSNSVQSISVHWNSAPAHST